MNSLRNNCFCGLRRFALLLAVISCLSLNAQENTSLLSGGAWSKEQVADGVKLLRASFDGNLFETNQYLCILEIAPGARFDIVPAADRTLEKTSALADEYGAVAAVNGSFFIMKEPYGSANYLRVDGVEVSPNTLDSYENPGSGRSTRQRGAVATWHGDLFVLKSDELRSWEHIIAAEDVVTTGPMLLIDGQDDPMVVDKFNTTRNPRTAVGRRADGTILLVVVDGRNAMAAGLTMFELRQVMAALGCRDAVNLDGGGSTTMVVRGQVVNHPSDNREFDAEGERVVANAIVVSIPARPPARSSQKPAFQPFPGLVPVRLLMTLEALK